LKHIFPVNVYVYAYIPNISRALYSSLTLMHMYIYTNRNSKCALKQASHLQEKTTNNNNDLKSSVVLYTNIDSKHL